MKNHPIKKLQIPEIPVYLGIVFMLSLIILVLRWQIGIMVFALFIYLIYYNGIKGKARKKEWNQYLDALSENIDWATKNVVSGIPMPLVVISMDGSIDWYNSYFSKMIGEENLLDRNINKYVPELASALFPPQKNNQYTKEIGFRDRRYRISWVPVQTHLGRSGKKMIFMIYWQDITEEVSLRRKFQDETITTIYICVDNYDEVINNTEEIERPVVLAEIEANLGKWAASLEGSWQKFDRDKFIVIIQNRYLKLLEEHKFGILDDIREINSGNQIPVTLSIGVGAEGATPAQSSEHAQAAIELALGRGGDQAVVKKGSKYSFYGGKAKAVEKRSRVRSRVIASALRQLMEQSQQVIIMSHQTPDLDSLGAALGIYRCARHIGKEAFILLEAPNASISYLVTKLKDSDGYRGVLINSEEARRRLDKQSIIVVVDTHRPSFMEAPELLSATERIVVIDHHRRSAEFIENATLSYLEPYASSASELVTEIVQYFDEKLRLNALEAEAMLAGITVDTKNFILKTGVRTFEAAAYLRRIGADPTSVRQLFQDDLETFTARAETVKSARMVAPGIAISQCASDVKNAPLIAAQAADSLITIKGIGASFVLSADQSSVIISGRSLGGINVQVILEKLGGGGHLTIAGARLVGIGIEDGREKLIEAIKEYLEDGESK